jgi:hypothetical protein
MLKTQEIGQQLFIFNDYVKFQFYNEQKTQATLSEK